MHFFLVLPLKEISIQPEPSSPTRFRIQGVSHERDTAAVEVGAGLYFYLLILYSSLFQHFFFSQYRPIPAYLNLFQLDNLNGDFHGRNSKSKTCVESHQNLRYCKFLEQWHFKTLIPVGLAQPTLANSRVFQVIPAFSSPSQSLIAYSSQFEASLSCSSLYKHVPAYYSPFQDIPDFYNLFQLIQAFSAQIILVQYILLFFIRIYEAVYHYKNEILRFNSFNITFKRRVFFTVHSLGSIQTNCQ